MPEALKALGNKIVTVVGDCPVRLKGVDVPGLEWSNTGDGPSAPNKNLVSVQRAVNNWTCNFIRLPLAQDRWLGTACGTSVTAYRAQVQQIVDWCNSNNAYVLLDLHWSDRGTAGSANACSAGQQDMPDDNSLLFWQSVASTVGIANNPAVLFDLYNEPGKNSSVIGNNSTGWDLWRNGGTVAASADGVAFHTPGMQALLMAIRAAGANNLVGVGGLDWAFNLSGITTYAAALTDTASGQGVAYFTHIYPFKWGGNGCVVPACFDGAVPASVLNNYPVLVTEFGPNVGDPEGFLSPLLAWITLHDLGFSAWSFHPGAAPCLINDFTTYAPTSYFGTPFLNYLLGTNPLGCVIATATPSPTASPSPTPLPSCGNVNIFRINCGGTAFSDSSGKLWAADSNSNGGSASSTTVTVSGTTDQALFRTNRWSGAPLSYTFSVPNGSYQVKILQSENYFNAAGMRIFSIYLQGTVVQSNLDLFAVTGGKYRALTLTYTATVSTGTLTIDGVGSVDNPQFAGIEITYVGVACSPTITPSPSITPTWTVSPYQSPTETFTISPTFSESPTFSPSPTVTATFTPVVFGGPLKVLSGCAVPNPNPAALSIQLSRPADSISVEIYSVGLTEVMDVQKERCSGGYNTLTLPAAWASVPNGVYFVRARAKLGGEEAVGKVFRVMKLR